MQDIEEDSEQSSQHTSSFIESEEISPTKKGE